MNKKLMTLLSSSVVLTMGCSGGSSGGSTSLTVSGALSVSNSAASNIIRGQRAVDLTQYDVACATTTTPVTMGTSDVHSDGTFTVDVQGAAGQPMSCYLVDSNGDKAADFLVSDSSKKDLNGNSEQTTAVAFDKSPNLGTITYDPAAGEVTIPSSQIDTFLSTLVPTAATVFDPTGAWTIASVDFALPKGTKGACVSTKGGASDCHGPEEGMSIYLKMWKGLVTATNEDIYGLQVWQGQAKYNACGSRIGLTSAIKSSLGVDFSANGSADNVFTFASSVLGFHDNISSLDGDVTLTDNWKMSTATLQHDLMPLCGPHDITAGVNTYSNAWVCGPDSGSKYQAQLGGGCVRNSDGKNVDVRDWTGITCPGGITTDSDGIKSNTCTGTASINGVPTAVTCSNKWAVVDSSYAVQTSPGASFNWNDLSVSKISSGTLCSSIANSGDTNALKIAQLQCYGDYYYRSGMEDASACLPKVNLDWSANTPANFEKVDAIRPQGLIFFEKFNIFPDGSGGSMTTRQEHYEGVQVKDSWVNCSVIEMGSLSFKKITASKLLMTYQSSMITTSTSKPACLGKFDGARETFVFYLTK